MTVAAKPNEIRELWPMRLSSLIVRQRKSRNSIRWWRLRWRHRNNYNNILRGIISKYLGKHQIIIFRLFTTLSLCVQCLYLRLYFSSLFCCFIRTLLRSVRVQIDAEKRMLFNYANEFKSFRINANWHRCFQVSERDRSTNQLSAGERRTGTTLINLKLRQNKLFSFNILICRKCGLCLGSHCLKWKFLKKPSPRRSLRYWRTRRSVVPSRF